MVSLLSHCQRERSSSHFHSAETADEGNCRVGGQGFSFHDPAGLLSHTHNRISLVEVYLNKYHMYVYIYVSETLLQLLSVHTYD